MSNIELTYRATMAVITSWMSPSDHEADRDRGSVSIEQVLWYAAAAISVAVVAGVIWSQIQTTANTAVTNPTAPG